MLVQGNYENLKQALGKKLVPQEHIELHKAEFHERRRDREEKLADIAGSIRRLAKKAYPEKVEELQDNLAKDQFISAFEDREIQMIIHESGLKTLNDAVSCALQLEAMFKAESRRTKGRQVLGVQQPSPQQSSKLLELLKQNKSAFEQMLQLVQKQHGPASRNRKLT